MNIYFVITEWYFVLTDYIIHIFKVVISYIQNVDFLFHTYKLILRFYGLLVHIYGQLLCYYGMVLHLNKVRYSNIQSSHFIYSDCCFFLIITYFYFLFSCPKMASVEVSVSKM